MNRRIACGHCGGHHGSVAEAKACAMANPIDGPVGGGDGAGEFGPPPEDHTTAPSPPRRSSPPRPRRETRPTPPAAAPAPKPTESKPLPCDAATLVGPPCLGRSVLVNRDDAVPEPWQHAPEITADASADEATVDRLHQAWRDREAVIIRWSGPLPDPEPLVDKVFHQLTVGEQPPGERLAFAITANTVDAREARPRFEPASIALAAGATLSAEGELTIGGRPVLVDGGPVEPALADAVDEPLVPRVHLLAGSLAPMTAGAGAPTAALAPDQLAAVSHRAGAARILAPAGSGKTRVLTERARYLINGCGVGAPAVSLVAYNRRAKDEMRDRLSDVAGLDIRTLNSLALAVATGRAPFRLTRSGRAPSTIGELDVRRMLDRVVPGRRRRKLTDPLEPWVDALSACRLGLRDPHEIEAAYGGDVAGFPEVLDRYRQALADANLIDFDEQILLAIDRLLTDVGARRAARAAAPMLLIDEFQDLTPAHLLLLRLIAGPAGEVFGVGDDDQTIYGYAGASPDWLIHFERFFPGAADHRLTVNYRCPTDVVGAATNLLSYNRRRVVKEISAGPEAEPGGLEVLTGDPQDNLVARVDRLSADGAAPTDIAVLTRVNAALLPAAVHLAEAGVPVVRPLGLTTDVLDRSGVGAAMSWLRLASGPERGFRADDLRLALRRPPRSLHPRVADWACEQESVKALMALSDRLNTEREAETIAAFAADIETLRAAADGGTSTEELLVRIYDEVGLLGAASQLDRSQRSARRAAHADELSALAAVARLHPNPATFDGWLRTRIDEIPRFDPERSAAGVTLATIHTTKGLEWPHVIVHDVRDGLFPHRLADDVEEERRIFHVGVTRGRSSVAVTVSGPPSPFVTELAERRPADLAWPEEPTTLPGTTEPGDRPKPKERAEPSTADEAALRDALTTFRRDRSRADGVPAYVVLDNKTLDAIAREAPRSLVALGSISGIGPAKLERYGADILGIVETASPT